MVSWQLLWRYLNCSVIMGITIILYTVLYGCETWFVTVSEEYSLKIVC